MAFLLCGHFSLWRFTIWPFQFGGCYDQLRNPGFALSVRLRTESCLLCIFHNTSWIHFIFTLLSTTSKGVWHVDFFFFFWFQNVSFCPSFYIMLWPSLNVTSPYLRNGWSNWHRTKGIWIDMMLDSLYDLDVWPHPWPWPWIFKVKYWNCCFMNRLVQFILIHEYRSCKWWCGEEWMNIYIYILCGAS